jgi:hypothetical protein
MIYLGQIESAPYSEAIDEASWIGLIRSFPHLKPVSPKKITNPFTREPIEVHAPATTGIIWNGVDLGSIEWAQDDSRTLNVYCKDDAVEEANSIAQEIARLLGARFIAERTDL